MTRFEKRARSKFIGSLRRCATPDEAIELLGEPEDVGYGTRGFKILAYRNKRLQLTFKKGSLFLVAFYFTLEGSESKWPQAFPVFDTFSGATTEEELMAWLAKQDFTWEKDGNRLRVDDEISLILENGTLSSIQILDNETPASSQFGA